MTWKNMIPVPVVIPLLVSAVLAGGGRFLSRKLIGVISLATAVISCISCLMILKGTFKESLVYWFGGWAPRSGMAIGVAFFVDPFSAGMALMVSVLMLGSLLFSWHYFKSFKGIYHSLMLIFLSSMCGFCFSGDLFNLFVWFELMSACAVALCAYKSDELQALNGAINFAVTNTVGAYLSLTGIALLYIRTGTLNMAQAAQFLAFHSVDSLVITGFLFFCSGFLVKAAVVPFHFWLADAHAVAPTPVSVLFSGTMVELGLYAVARIYWLLFSIPLGQNAIWIRHLFLGIGTVTALVGGILCYLQRHVKRLLAFSTISHVGLMVMAFALLESKGLTGMALYWVGHGFIKASLFMLVGVLLFRCESVDEYALKGKGRDLPFIRILYFIAALALSGLFPFANSLGESWVDESSASLHLGWVSWVFILSAALTSGAVLRVGFRVFTPLGAYAPDLPFQDSRSVPQSDEAVSGEEEPETDTGSSCVPFTMKIPVVLFLLLALVPAISSDILCHFESATARFMDAQATISRVLQGLTGGIAEGCSPGKPVGEVVLRSLLTAGVALALGLGGLWGVPQVRRSKKKLLQPLRWLGAAFHLVHSGEVGDYLAWFTFGVGLYWGYLVWNIK